MPVRTHRLSSLIARLVLLSLAAVCLAVLRPARRAGAPVRELRARKRGSGARRAAVSLTFATLFFAGAAFSAGAGDLLVQAVEDQHASATAGESASPEAAQCESVQRNDWESEDRASSCDEDGAPAEPAAGESEAEATPEAAPAADQPQAPTETASPQTASPSTSAAIAAATGNVMSNAPKASGSRPSSHSPSLASAVRSRARLSAKRRDPAPPVIAPQPMRVQRASEPDPETHAPNMAATIWLHRALPDPTPASKRLTRPFARNLRFASARHHVQWSLVLGVLRARGYRGSAPASRKGLNRLAGNLSRLGARRDEWTAVLALEGRTAFADRAVALARYHRAVGLNALVRGLEWAKPMLTKKLLADKRVSIYPGGRSDLRSGDTNVRVIVLIRYMAEAHGQVTVSCLHSGHRLYSRPGVISRHIFGLAVDISGLEGKSIAGNQEPGGLTERAVRNLLFLPAELRPMQVISLLGLGGPSFPLANHDDHIHAGF